MANPTVLVCPCGMRLNAAGAVPGRVGKCPRCGGLLRVPDPKPSPPERDEALPGTYGMSPARPSTFVTPRGSDRRGPSARWKTAIWQGLVRAPARPEERLRDSLLYPLWGPSGVALLVFMPPGFWLTSIAPLTVVVTPGLTVANLSLAAFVSLLPTGLGLFLISAYTLLFLGRVLVSSAVGEVPHPRWPEFDLFDMLRGLGRWAWALAIGGIVGGFPAVAYWISCGDIDLFDRIVLVELIALGAVYGELALLASILHDDSFGANPVTVLRAIRRIGWGCLTPAMVIGSAALLTAMALAAIVEIADPPLAAMAYWVFWVFVLYEAMVVLRILGLFYHRNSRVLGWFRDRPRWGA